MWALRHPASLAAVPFFAGWSEARGLALACALAGAVAATGLIPREAAPVVTVAVVHGGLVAIALVWAGMRLTDAAFAIVLLGLARELVALHPLGALGYLGLPIWLGALARAGRLTRLGLGAPWPWGPVAIAALAGTALALHLVTCASRTLGYTIRLDVAIMLPAVAYDIGANVVSAELFFRGAVLHHLWRRWPFAVALAGASGAATVRYWLDPFVAATELRVGAAVYMTGLAVLNGVLSRWSGSLLPGLVAATIFFTCYRLLASG